MILDIDAGKGLKANEDGELSVVIDKNHDGDLKVSENGVWARGLNGLNTNFVDEWTVTSSHDPDEVTEKNIWLNTRVATRCYCFCMFKAKRPFTGSKNFGGDRNKSNAMYTIEPADALNEITVDIDGTDTRVKPGDLKDVLDVIREVNFPVIYSKYEWSGDTGDPTQFDFEPPVILRPGSLIAFSDTIYCSDYGANAMYENGMRMPKLTTFNGYKKGSSSESEVVSSEQPQHIYALFMVTKSNYSEHTAYDADKSGEIPLKPAEDNTFQVNPAPYPLLMRLQLKCIWSDQDAFNHLLNTDGWHVGEFMKQWVRDDYSDDVYTQGTAADYGKFELPVTYQDWGYVHTVFKGEQ
jgi:hypothetical protein